MTFHFVGMGGSGMSVLAELFAKRGEEVQGSDERDTPKLRALEKHGIRIFVGHSAANVPAEGTVVRSSAIRFTNPEIVRAQELGLPILHRSEALALASEGKRFAAIAGAHGKTTTSSMLAFALTKAGADPSFVVGGSIAGLGTGARLGGGDIMVAEADESDRSFLNYSPQVAVVTNVDADHLDFYKTAEAYDAAFRDFLTRIQPGGLLIGCADDPGAAALLAEAGAAGIRTLSYGRGEADVVVDETSITSAGVRRPFELQVLGNHNRLNAAAAFAAGVELGIEPSEMIGALGAFQGAKRRFEKRGEVRGVEVIDDSAHHPTEVETTLSSIPAREGRVIVMYQPLLYARTVTFAQEFADALRHADEVIVTHIFSSREDPIQGVTGEMISRLLPGSRYIEDGVEASRAVAREAQAGDLLIVMGGGDVDRFIPNVLEFLAES